MFNVNLTPGEEQAVLKWAMAAHAPLSPGKWNSVLTEALEAKAGGAEKWADWLFKAIIFPTFK